MTRDDAVRVLDAVNELWPHQPWRKGEREHWVTRLVTLNLVDVEAAVGHFAHVGGSAIAMQNHRRPGLAEMVSTATQNAVTRLRVDDRRRRREDNWPDPEHAEVVARLDEIRTANGLR